MPTAIKIENLSKQYRLGQVGTGTLSHDLNRWWARLRGKEDPYSKIGQVNKRDQAAESDYVWALKDINLEVEQGEVLGIIGANGSGKSTLLKIISRITAPTTGFVKAKGRIASLLEVGTGMHPEMTARENIYLNGSILGMRRREIARKFDDIIDFAGCRMYVDTPVKRYSSGMRVRLGFAVAAFLEPEILIVDEVLAVGDAEFQKRAVGKMQEVSKSGARTILFVSHNLEAVTELCTHAYALNNGTVNDSGPADYVVRRYKELTVKSTADGRVNHFSTTSISTETFEVRTIDIAPKHTYALGRNNDSIAINFYCVSQLPIQQLLFSFALLNSEGQSCIWNRVEGRYLHPQVSQGEFILTLAIPPLPLRTGVYSVNFMVRRSQSLETLFHALEMAHFYLETESLTWSKGVLTPPICWQIAKPSNC